MSFQGYPTIRSLLNGWQNGNRVHIKTLIWQIILGRSWLIKLMRSYTDNSSLNLGNCRNLSYELLRSSLNARKVL